MEIRYVHPGSGRLPVAASPFSIALTGLKESLRKLKLILLIGQPVKGSERRFEICTEQLL